MKVFAAVGLGFAVPIDSVSKIMEHFKKNGYVSCFCLKLSYLAIKLHAIDNLALSCINCFLPILSLSP